MVSPVDVVAVVGTFLALAGFLSLTAFVAARNVLGDVPADRALLVGPLPALVSFVLQGIFPLVTVALAVAVDLAVIRWVYEIEWREAAYVTFIHVVVSILLGVAVVGAVILVFAG